MAGMAVENHGWFAYSVLLVVAAVAALVPLLLQFTSRFFRKVGGPHSQPPSDALKSSVVSTAKAVNTRYFTATQVGASLILPIFLVIPLVNPASGRTVWSSLSLITLCVTTGVALIYVNRKGDLRWIGSTQRQNDEESGDSQGEAP